MTEPASVSEHKLAAVAHQLQQSTTVLQHEREALAATESFREPDRVFGLLARVETIGALLHKRLVEWHTRHPDRPSLAETDAFWADLKHLRAAKEELHTALEAIRARERYQPTLRAQLEHATSEAGDVERHFSTYLDRINAR